MEPPKICRLGLTGQITWVLMFGAPLLLAVAILLGIMALTEEGDIPTFLVVPWVALLILSLVHALYRGVTSTVRPSVIRGAGSHSSDRSMTFKTW